MWGRELVEKGCIRSIGNGETTSIYFDKWIPRPSLFKVWSPKSLHPHATVSELILPSGGWNIPLIQNSFNEIEAELITGIPLGNTNNQDQWRWFFDKKGRYTVKSGYKLAMEVERSMSNKGGNSSNKSNNKFWKVIWGLQIPNKIKLFLWRAIHGILPCAQSLYQRRITDNPCCFRCGANSESVFHALWGCHVSRIIWKQSKWKDWKIAC